MGVKRVKPYPQTRFPLTVLTDVSPYPMKRLALVLVLASAVSVNAEDPEFAKLQKIQRDAITKAVTPINEGYVRELRRLLEKQTRAGKLDDAKVTMEEIEKIEGVDESKSITSESHKDLEKLVVGRGWKMVGGSKYNFKKDGEGVREYNGEKTTFIWRASSPNMVEVTGKLGSGGTFRTFYFKLISLKEGYYGDTPDKTDLALALD
jgi:hypothetical protein